MPEPVDKNNYMIRVADGRGVFSSKSIYLGIILATLSSLFFSLCSVIVKSLTDVNPIELAMFRFVGLLPALSIAIYKEKPIFPKEKRILLLLRCFVGCTGLVLSFYSFRHMQLADASVIIFSTPVFVAIFAKCFLREPCGVFNVITIALTLCGIVLITRPRALFGETPNHTDGNNIDYNLFGPASAFGSTLFSANAYVLLRALKGLHYSVIMTNFGLFALVYTAILSWFFGTFCWPKCGWDRMLIVALAVFSFGGQILLTQALQMEQAGPVSVARSSDIVFAFIWQIIFFNEIPTIYTILGALLVVAAVLLSGLRKYVLALPLESEFRKKYKFLTIE